jgi:hypothetical protein
LYSVDKYWIVTEQRDGQITLLSRRGKLHLVDANDPRLRPASWWERLIYRDRFPTAQTSNAQQG